MGDTNRKQIYTMKDVANLAGVTQPTVSHVINGTANVSREVTEKVHAAVEVLNYRPNALASGLKTNTTKTIGIISPDISNSYYSCIAKELEALLMAKGYISFLSSTDYDRDSEKKLIDKLLRYNVDGVVVMCEFLNSEPLKSLEYYGMPVVYFDYIPDERDGCLISSDNVKGGYLAVSHLIERGKRRIAYLGEKELLYPLKMRYNGYKKALAEFGIPLDEDLVILDDDMVYNSSRGLQYGRMMLQKNPDAVFASTDMIAIGFMRACADSGVKIPDDVAIVGYDNIPLAPLMMPALTTVTQSAVDIAEVTLQQLLLQIEGKPYEKKIVLEPQLIIRETA
jgi:LacI family transcriptional regulator